MKSKIIFIECLKKGDDVTYILREQNGQPLMVSDVLGDVTQFLSDLEF